MFGGVGCVCAHVRLPCLFDKVKRMHFSSIQGHINIVGIKFSLPKKIENQIQRVFLEVYISYLLLLVSMPVQVEGCNTTACFIYASNCRFSLLRIVYSMYWVTRVIMFCFRTFMPQSFSSSTFPFLFSF